MHFLITDNLALVPWEERFKDELALLVSDDRVVRYINDGKKWSREFVDQRHRAYMDHWSEHGFGWRGIVDPESRKFLGVAALNQLNSYIPGIPDKSLEIGWWVSPAVWGKGIATEAALALRDEALIKLGAQGIVARAQPENTASIRVAKKIGMRFFGGAIGGAGESIHVYVLESSEFQKE